MGMAERPATSLETLKMCEIVERSLEVGAFGFSTGLIYPPCNFADQAELLAISEVTAKHGGLFAVHVRDERRELLDSVKTILDISRESNAKPHISHLKVLGKESWGTAGRVLALFDEAMDAGIQATFDQYPYPAGSTRLSILVPQHAHAGGPEQLIARLSDSEIRTRLAQEIEADNPGWENIAMAAGWDGVFVSGISSGPNKHWEGMSLSQIAQIRQTTPAEALFDVLIAEKLNVSMINFSQSEEDVRTIMQHPCGMLGTDGLLVGKPHPRAYGSTVRILEKYVREEKLLTIETAVQRMTGRPAARLGLKDRGVIAVGAKADLVLFDMKRLKDCSSFADPCRHPEGIEYVFVNGQAAIKNGVETGLPAGQVLRKVHG